MFPAKIHILRVDRLLTVITPEGFKKHLFEEQEQKELLILPVSNLFIVPTSKRTVHSVMVAWRFSLLAMS